MHDLRLKRRIQLSKRDFLHLAQLFKLCEQSDGVESKIYWSCLKERAGDVCRDYFVYKNNLLVAYLGVFNFNDQDSEICALVHPRHRRQSYFQALLSIAISEITYKKVNTILLPCNQAIVDSRPIVLALGSSFKHAEYTLQLNSLQSIHTLPLEAERPLRLIQAGVSDMSLLTSLDKACFNNSRDGSLQRFSQTIHQTNRLIYLASLEDEVIGKIHIHFIKNQAFIHDFCILPKYQGQRFGRDLMVNSLQLIKEKMGVRSVGLEAYAENEKAVNLYIKLGFEIKQAYDFYVLNPFDFKPNNPRVGALQRQFHKLLF